MSMPLDRARIARQFNRAAHSYDAAAHLQQRVRDELLERLGALRIAPQAVLDLGAGTGAGTIALATRYPQALCCALDIAPEMLVEAARRMPNSTALARLGRGLGLVERAPCFERVCGDAERLPFVAQRFDLIFSSLMLQWAADPDACLRELHRVLRTGGLLCFSTFGPNTLRELRNAWAAVDTAAGREHSHVSPFVDILDLGSALTRAGFSQCVLDVDLHQTVYPDVLTLMHELRAIGALNATLDRPRSLLGRSTLRRLEQAYAQHRLEDGALPASWEVVYGLAYADSAGPVRAAAEASGEIIVPVDRLTLRRRPSP